MGVMGVMGGLKWGASGKDGRACVCVGGRGYMPAIPPTPPFWGLKCSPIFCLSYPASVRELRRARLRPAPPGSARLG